MNSNLSQPAASACTAPTIKEAAAQKSEHRTRRTLRLAVHPLFRDLLLTMATELGILIAGLLLVSLFGRLLGPVALGEFLLLRRVTSWLITGALLGMGNAIPRFVAFSVNKPEADRRAYFLAGSGCLLACAACAEVVFYFGRKPLADWMFGSAQFSYLVLPLGLLFAGLAVQTAVYGYYRGIMDLRRANALQLLHFAILPLGAVALLYPTQSVVLILDVTGAATLLVALVYAWPIYRSLRKTKKNKLAPYTKELLHYGIGRVPGNFGSGAFLSLAPLIATHYVSMTEVGYLLLGVNFLTVMGYTTGPVGILLLSKLSAMLGQNRMAETRASLSHLVIATLDISVFAAVQLVIFADVLIRAWVGVRFLDALTVTRILILAIPPYLLFMVLRSCIDAASPKAWNTGNILVSLAIFGVLIAVTVQAAPLSLLLDALAVSLVVGLVVLGFLTTRTFKQLFGLPIPLKAYAVSILVGVLLGALSCALRTFIGLQGNYALAALLEAAVVAIFVGVHAKLRSPWLRFIWQMAFSNPNGPSPLSAEHSL